MPLARALVAGGVRVLEVTLRTLVAIPAAKAIMADVPEAVVGIGTILNADDLARAEDYRRPVSASVPAPPRICCRRLPPAPCRSRRVSRRRPN